MNKVYATDVAGVGIRLYRQAAQASNTYPHTLNINTRVGEKTILDLNEGYFQVELIKTATTTGSGPIASAGPFTTYYADGSGISRPILTSSLSGIGITIVTSTCEVDAGSKTSLSISARYPVTPLKDSAPKGLSVTLLSI